MTYAIDINGKQLETGDIVRVTQKRKDLFPWSSDPGSELRITEIYMHVDGAVAGSLTSFDGSGVTIFHSTLSLYEFVRKSGQQS